MTLKKSVMMVLVIVLALGAIVSDVYSAEAKFDLKLKLKKGQKFGLKMVTDQKMSQTMMGQQQKMNQMTAMGMSFEVLDVDDNGNISIKTTHLNIHARIEGPMGVMEYDSTKPQEPGANNPMSAMYKAMLGQSFVMKLSPKGEILEIKGMDEMIAKMIDKMATDEAMKQQMKEMMKNFINEDKMKETSGTMVAALPPKPVGIGDSWTNKISVAVGFPMEIDTTNTLTDHKEGIITIKTNASIEMGDDAKPTEMGPMKMTMKMKGAQKGTIQIDQATGWLVRSKADANFTGEFKTEPNEQMPQPMTIPIAIESVTTVEPMAVK
jgi:hypothetical protein